MKAKLKLDKQAIQGFFVRHVEKLVLAGLLFVFLGLAYGAATHPTYNRQPRELQEAAQRADQNIEQIKQPTAPSWAKVNAYPEIAQRSRNVVSETAYVWPKPMDNLIWPPLALRPEPPLFATEDLKGTAGVGAIQMKTASGQQQVGQRWIVITGLVPAAKQVQAYTETFKDLKRPESDTPRYIHFWVERAEMFGDARDANPVWTQINVLEAKQIQNSWTTTAQEAVAAPFIHDPLVFPLGPLMSGTWDESVAHPPKIRLASATLNGTQQPVVTPKPGGLPDVPQQPDMPPGVVKPAADLPPAAPGAVGGGAVPGPAGAGAAVAAAPAAGGAVAPVAAAPGTEAAAGGGEGHGHTADVMAVEYLLLRFFDFKVEPGKRYSYRVKLLLANPNYKCEVRYLTSPALAEKTFIDTEWSEPCPPVFVPRDDRLLAGPVKAPTRAFGAEPVATVTLVKWMAEHGTETSQEFKIVRGQLANLSSEASALADGEGGEGAGGGLIDDAATTKAKKKDKDSGPRINFKSDALLLDIRGGAKWGNQTFEPGELLVLDWDGRLVVRSEIDDISLLPKPKAFKEDSDVTVTVEKDKDKDKDKKTKSSLFGDDFGDKKKKESKKEKTTGKKK
jgi:hypothetical protein